MKCPIDTTVDLLMTDRSGIEIDYCPTCRGVWLDRGELDKLIERSATAAPTPAAPAAPTPPVVPPSGVTHGKYHGKYHSKYRAPYGGQSRKRKSLLGEIFDF